MNPRAQPQSTVTPTQALDGSFARSLTFGVATELGMFAMPGNVARLRRATVESDTIIGPGDVESFVEARVAGRADPEDRHP